MMSVIASGDTQHQQWELLVSSIKNVELTAEQKIRAKKYGKAKRALRESGYEAVIKHFSDSQDLKYVWHTVFALRNLEDQIVEDLIGIDGEVAANTVRSCVLENLVRWDENILGGVVGRLMEATEPAWKEFDRLDSFNEELE
ncbi:hypothetical protein [Bradyrhizobium sp. 2S1]|uniref:hypothetical protein n=1 Tax=Bradyrhizobium sp. 2S1 TaxID=1404429 RepID=UPI00140A1D1A|nr:hypothetical protein [Bradyrhizobium sp. 2S1]MCK7666156.1 hypothetical protein [Bradyrhizobium sp. 2S1]